LAVLFYLTAYMNILSLEKDNLDDVLGKAVDALGSGEVIAYPTESYYAIGVSAEDKSAVERLYQIKERPSVKPLPLIVGDMEQLRSIVKSVPLQAKALIKEYWPGPLTLIFEYAGNLPLLLTGESKKVAVRIPGESAALHLARKAGFPVTATSANPSGRPPAMNADEVRDYFEERIDLLIDGGKTPGGKPSTIIDVTVAMPVILREGRVLLKPKDKS